MPQQPDLFPETLLVESEGERIYTTSLKVAEHFHKRHKHVLRDIERIIADCADRGPNFGPTINSAPTPETEFCQRNFEAAIRDVPGPKGAVRQEKIYRLTEEGFALLAMGFTGKEALRWKIDFLSAFRAMEAQLKAQAEREAQALHWLRPHWRAIGAGVAAGLSRREIIARTGHKSPGSVTRAKARMRAAGLLD